MGKRQTIMLKLQNYINGKLVAPQNKQYIDNYNPANGAIYSLIPKSDKKDLEKAVEAAENAFLSWKNTPQEERSNILLRIADLIEKDLHSLASAESFDNGKPVSLATAMDIPRAAQNFRFYATAALHNHTNTYQTSENVLNYTLREPLGVVGCISPWNLPLYLFTWKIAPALASGNCVIAKPSEITPYTAFLLSKICIKAGLPAGVLNIVHGLGSEIGAEIVAHPQIKAISFTGGTQTGANIARVAAPMFKKLSLELGGKNPTIIFADADYQKALLGAVRAAFTNQGQICLCGSRIFIEKSIYEQFKKDFVEEVKKLIPANPYHKNTNFGAVVSKEHLEKIISYVEIAKSEGGKILCGGTQAHPQGCENGYFFQPTVIEGLTYDCRTNQEEIFGAIATIQPFETEEEVLKYANSVRYGLSASIWTENNSRVQRISKGLASGIVWVNCWLIRDLRTPFGGVKDSGMGREGGFEALNFFTEEKNICIQNSVK